MDFDTKSSDRPEWLPEKFKTPEDLATSYKELETKFMTKTEDLKSSLLDEMSSEVKEGVPQDATGYEVPEGYGGEAAKDSPIWESFTQWSHERQLSQDDFNELVDFYATALTPDLDAERSKLGDNAEARLNALSRWVGTNVPDENKQALLNMATTAENIQALEAIMKLTVPQKLPTGDTDVSVSTEALDDNKVKELMMSKAYVDPTHRDPEVVRQVDEYFKAKYAG